MCMYGIGSWIEYDEFGMDLIWDMEWFMGEEWWILGMILACDLNEMVGIKVTWYWYERKFYIHGLGRMSWYGFHMWYEWGLVTEVGMRFLCMIYILLVVWIWLVCGQYVIPWASRWDLMVVLQWSGRNSMTPVSGSSWWCPIYII